MMYCLKKKSEPTVHSGVRIHLKVIRLQRGVRSNEITAPLRMKVRSYTWFPTLGGWAPLTPELFKDQWCIYIYVCVYLYIYFIHISVPSPLLPTRWAGVEADEEVLKVSSQGLSGL